MNRSCMVASAILSSRCVVSVVRSGGHPDAGRSPAHGILGEAHGIPFQRIARTAASTTQKACRLSSRRRCDHAFISRLRWPRDKGTGPNADPLEVTS